MFDPGATLSAKELENNSDKKKELEIGDTELNTDSEVEHGDASTPARARDQRKKRVRKNMKFGHLGCIQGIKDNNGVSSEEEHSEEAIKEVKKPRLVGSSETKEENNDREILEEGNMADDKTNNSEKLAEEKVGDNVHSSGLKVVKNLASFNDRNKK